jgi:DNA invertase Pin-like site-specific DNA recombinase
MAKSDKYLIRKPSIDRLGRDLRDIINTIHFFTEKKISIYFVSQGLITIVEICKQKDEAQPQCI